ncbi:MAG: tellurite resistance protein [Bradymonadia bacterium]|jgi:tellurite resistance protein
MDELYEGIELSEIQTEWICRGLLDLAKADGLHESELELIQNFATAGGQGSTDVAALKGKGFELAEASKVLGADERITEAFLVSCYLLIYADGRHSDEERTRISEYATSLNVPADALENLHVKARLYLLQMLAQGLRNKEAVRQVGVHQLGLNPDQITGLMED